MLTGYTLTPADDGLLTLYCDVCPDGGMLVHTFYMDPTPLEAVVTAVKSHIHRLPAGPKKYDVFEARDGRGFIVWDRVRRMRVAQTPTILIEADAQSLVDEMNAVAAREAAVPGGSGM